MHTIHDGCTRTITTGFSCLMLAACGGTDDTDTAARDAGPSAPAVVYVVNYPLHYFAERIGEDAAQIEFPAPSDVDPAFWVPDADVIAAYQQADLILLNGATYAKWVDRVSLPPSKLVNTSMAFADDYLQVDGAVTHTHGPQGEHAHTGTAFTTWLDPSLAIRQARSIRDALARRVPDHATAFGQRFAEVERDLTELDEQLRAAVKLNPTRPLLASHPVYQYLAARYDLDLRSVQWEPEEMPGEAEWQRDLRVSPQESRR